MWEIEYILYSKPFDGKPAEGNHVNISNTDYSNTSSYSSSSLRSEEEITTEQENILLVEEENSNSMNVVNTITNNEIQSNKLNNNVLPTKYIKSGKQKTKTQIVKNGVDYERIFPLLWKFYPNNNGKPMAQKRFREKIKTEEDLNILRFALPRFLQSEKTRQGENYPKFIPHLSTYLSQERFRDYEEMWHQCNGITPNTCTLDEPIQQAPDYEVYQRNY